MVALQLVYGNATCDFDGEPSFNNLWSFYPRRVGKKEALKAWDKLTTEQRESAVSAIHHHIKYWAACKTELQYIPHCSTWLNQWRFEDEVVIPSNWSPLSSSLGK